MDLDEEVWTSELGWYSYNELIQLVMDLETELMAEYEDD